MTVAKRVLNERGQAAIFVALIFNVLFVFFAMSINIALVVHDKINLQNSTDLAAYYAATKQAELLNVIAHQNYQIRQSYKLLAWRYHVLGTMGLYQQEPNPVWTGSNADTEYSQGRRPSLCITYKPTWAEVPENENLCNRPNLRIPPLPEVRVIAGFLGLNHSIAALSRQLREQFDVQCQKMGAYNWWFAMSILHAFRLDQRNRKLVLQGVAKSMSLNAQNGDFTDLDGNSVLEGARQTFLKNLTFANRQSYDSGGGEFTMMNSLQGIDPREWLPEINITPTLLYTDVDENPGCNADPRPVQSLPQRDGARKILNAPYPNGLQASNLIPWKDADLLRDSDFQYSIGVEKNPWYVPYVGVRVKTTPRQIFFPFGSGLEMTARAFAKPFGGRIGPWYQSRWDRGGRTSTGDLVDPLMAPRADFTGSQNDMRRLPNYSRYPGDQLGMASNLAINSLAGLATLGISYDSYKNIKEEITNNSPNDILAWNANGTSPDVRNFEIAAITPDLFDITYYSIEPNFTKNYWERLNTNKSKLGISGDVPVRPDLGHNGTTVAEYSIQQQMELAKSKNLQKAEAYYFVREKAHLLTSWLPGKGTYNYDVAESMENFGRCALPDDGLKFKNPGSCVAGGGRTGYSVKLVSRDLLFSSEQKIGGAAPAGAIMNPPKNNDGW